MHNQRGMAFSYIHLGHAYMGLNQLASAQKAYQDALKISENLSLLPLELAALVGFAQLLSSTQPERALALLQLPLTHPASWQRVQEEAQKLSEQIARELTSDQVESTRKQGMDLHLDQVVADLLNPTS